MTERVSIPRVRSVRLKSGGAQLHIVRPNEALFSGQRMLRAAGKIIEGTEKKGTALAGFALVAWQADGRVWAAVRNSPLSPVGAPLIPDVVRSALLLHNASDEARELINEANGYGPPDQGA